MKKIYSTLLIAIILGCSSSKDPEPIIIVGKYEIPFIYEYVSAPGKQDINASINTIPNTNFIDFKADGSCEFIKTGFRIRGISPFGIKNYQGTYIINEKELEITLMVDGKPLKYIATIDNSSNIELLFKTVKSQFLRANAANKSSLSAIDYENYNAEYNAATRYEQEVTLEKQ